MNLVGLLTTAALITLASSTTATLADSQRARIPLDPDHLLLVMLLNHRDLGFKKKPPEEVAVPDEYSRAIEDLLPRIRNLDKRTNSMSVVNSVDVMRERVLLELARRKALEDQRTLGDNRHFLNFVGKRSGKITRDTNQPEVEDQDEQSYKQLLGG